MRWLHEKIKLVVPSQVAMSIIKQKFHEPSKDILLGITTPVLLLRSTIPEAFHAVRISETDRLKQSINLNVIDVPEATHDIYWDQPKFLSEQIMKWITE